MFRQNSDFSSSLDRLASHNDTRAAETFTMTEMLLPEAACAKCGAAGSAKKCACKLVFYCSKECQRGDWAEHKARKPQRHARRGDVDDERDTLAGRCLREVRCGWLCEEVRVQAGVLLQQGVPARGLGRAQGAMHVQKATTGPTAKQIDPQDAIPGLLNDIVVTLVLKSEYFDDPADLARLIMVSKAMRDAVSGTGLRFAELDELRAVKNGYVSALHRWLRKTGYLMRMEHLCQAAARSGDPVKLKVFRVNGMTWDEESATAPHGAGISKRCGGRARTAAGGTRTRARGRPSAGNSRRCNCCARTAESEARIRAGARRKRGTFRCCSSQNQTAVRGARTRT